MSKEQEKNACDWLENLEGDAGADACEEIAGAVKRQAEGAQDDRPEFERQFNMTGWHIDESYRSGSSYKYQEQRMAFDAWKIARAALAQPSPKCTTCNGTGMVDDGEIWCSEGGIPYENGPVKCVKDCPDCAQPSPAPELDFAKPLETASGEPVKWICSDVIEYKSARVCVDQNTGLVYSSPYIGLKIRNVMPAPELERPEVVAWMWRDINGDIQFNYMHPEGELLMTVAQHERIVGALREKIDGAESQTEYQTRRAEHFAKERDAVLSRLAELEKQEPVYTKPSWADNYGWGGGHIDFKCAWEVEKLARHFEELLDAVPEGPLYAAPVAQAGQVPEKPTEAMLQAGMNAMAEAQRNGSQSLYVYAGVCWDAMLAAAPQPAKGGDGIDHTWCDGVCDD